MGPLLVVEPEPFADARSSLRYQPVVPQVNLFVLQRTPQPFNEDVVETTAAPVHADRDAARFQLAGEFLAGELRTLVAVEDLGPPQRNQTRWSVTYCGRKMVLTMGSTLDFGLEVGGCAPGGPGVTPS